jgi:hypothetical protein
MRGVISDASIAPRVVGLDGCTNQLGMSIRGCDTGWKKGFSDKQ